jgi:hypothetical protein
VKCNLLFVLLVGPVSLFAQQSIDLFTASFRHGFTQSTSGVKGNATENVGLVNMKIPVVFSESTIWYSDLTYQAFNVDYSAGLTNTIDPTKIHGVILQTGLVKKLTEETGFQLLLVPRLMSDLTNVNSNHFQFGGIGLFEKRYGDHLMMRYGMMYNRERFGNMFVPALYLDWKIAPKWSIAGLLPVYAKLNFQVTERLGMGLSLFGLITSYQIGDPTYAGDYIERKSIDLTVYGRYKLPGNLYFETRFGYALGRSYSQYAHGDKVDLRIAIFTIGDDRIQKNVAFDPGPIIDFRLVYNLPID